eukprot:7638226-Prorocentrum_lima.AAC.1
MLCFEQAPVDSKPIRILGKSVGHVVERLVLAQHRSLAGAHRPRVLQEAEVGELLVHLRQDLAKFLERPRSVVALASWLSLKGSEQRLEQRQLSWNGGGICRPQILWEALDKTSVSPDEWHMEVPWSTMKIALLKS